MDPSQIFRQELQLGSNRLKYANTKQPLILAKKKEAHVGEGISVSDQQMRMGTVKKQDMEKFKAKGSLSHY